MCHYLSPLAATCSLAKNYIFSIASTCTNSNLFCKKLIRSQKHQFLVGKMWTNILCPNMFFSVDTGRPPPPQGSIRKAGPKTQQQDADLKLGLSSLFLAGSTAETTFSYYKEESHAQKARQMSSSGKSFFFFFISLIYLSSCMISFCIEPFADAAECP